jgi:hypothetical protein
MHKIRDQIYFWSGVLAVGGLAIIGGVITLLLILGSLEWTIVKSFGF